MLKRLFSASSSDDADNRESQVGRGPETIAALSQRIAQLVGSGAVCATRAAEISALLADSNEVFGQVPPHPPRVEYAVAQALEQRRKFLLLAASCVTCVLNYTQQRKRAKRSYAKLKSAVVEILPALTNAVKALTAAYVPPPPHPAVTAARNSIRLCALSRAHQVALRTDGMEDVAIMLRDEIECVVHSPFFLFRDLNDSRIPMCYLKTNSNLSCRALKELIQSDFAKSDREFRVSSDLAAPVPMRSLDDLPPAADDNAAQSATFAALAPRRLFASPSSSSESFSSSSSSSSSF
jgi:hypothetical protein